MFASLPMYARAETREDWEALWTFLRNAMRSEGFETPEGLDQSQEGLNVWLRDDLVLSQTCGMPYRKKLHGQVTLVGTFDHGLPNCPAGYYNSVIICRRAEGASPNSRAVINDPLSQSGYAAFLEYAPDLKDPLISGAHVKSAEMVASGAADIASIDAVTWAMIEAFDGFASSLDVIHRTEPRPALPLITRVYAERSDDLFAAIVAGLNDAPSSLTERLMIKGLVKISAEDYLSVKP